MSQISHPKLSDNLTPGISIVACRNTLSWNPDRILSQFQILAIHILMQAAAQGRAKTFGPSKHHTEILVLLEDLENICEMFEVERMRSSWRFMMEVELNPSTSKLGDNYHFAGLPTNFFMKKTQEKLLRPLRNRLRGVTPLEFMISGCTERDLLVGTLRDMTQRRWSNVDVLVAELCDLKARAGEYMLNGDLLDCTRLCAYGIRILLRVYFNPGSFTLPAENVVRSYHDLTHFCFMFHVLFARYLVAGLTIRPQHRTLAEEEYHTVRTYETILNVLSHSQCQALKTFLPWYPFDHELGETHYMKAKVSRIAVERSSEPACKYNGLFIRDEIERALALWPDNPRFEEEQKTIETLIRDMDRCRQSNAKLTLVEWRANQAK
ncbi:hypothetical protein CC86DRAFT_109842 [Ophiobolus disseminans]|uniref:Uncharacterized protein n=1 Tax=Ophiobolus disseminans TaxID=1469910 RepID=A0A6A6ZKG9_9PLEO|nr:hypothetical protein CC86DRAFT_109842 [Ophiobolus disseminans]